MVYSHSYTADVYNGAALFYYPTHETSTEYRRSQAQYDELNNRAAMATANLPGVKAAGG